jgi:hypothetical protein
MLPPVPPFPPVAVASLSEAVIGSVLPALAVTDSPLSPGWPLSPGLTPSSPAAPSSPCTVTISARTPAAPVIIKASAARPAINVRVEIERWIDFISAPSRRSPARETAFSSIRLRFEHHKTELSGPDHFRVWRSSRSRRHGGPDRWFATETTAGSITFLLRSRRRYRSPMPKDAFTLSDVREPTLTIVCEPCGRRGRYSVAKLMENRGDAKILYLLAEITNCPKMLSADIYDRCKARYEGLTTRG